MYLGTMFRKPSYLLIGSYLLLLPVMFVLPFFSMEGYSITAHSLSELGAQLTPNAWIMNTLFVLLGLGSIWAGRGLMYGFWVQRISLTLFGLALAMSGFFSHAPIDPSLDFNLQEDQLHSVFANITGISFTILAVSMVFMLKERKDQVLAWTMALISVLISLGIFLIQDLAGVFQRILFVASFAWLIYLFGFKED